MSKVIINCQCGNCTPCNMEPPMVCYVSHYCPRFGIDKNGKAFVENPCPANPQSQKDLDEVEERYRILTGGK